MYLCKLFVLSISNPSNNNLSVYCKNTSDATNPTIGHGSPEPRIAMFTHLIYATFERLLNPKYLATRSAHTIFYYIHMRAFPFNYAGWRVETYCIIWIASRTLTAAERTESSSSLLSSSNLLSGERRRNSPWTWISFHCIAYSYRSVYIYIYVYI